MSTANPHLSQTSEAAPIGVIQRLRQRLGDSDRSTIVSATVVAYLFVASVAWAMITPIGGVPDEPAHITYAAAVVRGDLGAMAAVDHPVYAQLAVVTVPEWVASLTDPPRSVSDFPYPCYGGGETVTAACAPRLSASTTPSRVPTTVTRYPPPYYWIVGLPTLVMAGEPAVYAMRVVSAALATAIVALGLAAASRTRRTWLALGAAVAFTPLVGHFAGSVNPTSIEITAAMGLGVGLMGIVGSERRNAILTSSLIVTLVFALAWARPRTYLAMVAVIAAATLVNVDELRDWLRNRAVRFTVLVGVAVATITAFGYGRLFTHPEAVADVPQRVSDSILIQPTYGIVTNLHELEQRFTGWSSDLIGRFGWLDHSPPGLVLIAWGGLALTLVLLAISYGRRRDRAALLTITIGALFLAPLFIVSRVLNALTYQARYHAPLALLIIIGATVALARLPLERQRDRAWRILRLGAMLAPYAMLITVAASLRRYGIGGEAQLLETLGQVFETHTWLPPSGAQLVAGISAVLMVTMAMIIKRTTTGGHRRCET